MKKMESYQIKEEKYLCKYQELLEIALKDRGNTQIQRKNGNIS